MSKLTIHINYKDACILKHALRDKVISKRIWLAENADLMELVAITRKELEEEERALEKITEQIKECGFMHNRQVFG